MKIESTKELKRIIRHVYNHVEERNHDMIRIKNIFENAKMSCDELYEVVIDLVWEYGSKIKDEGYEEDYDSFSSNYFIVDQLVEKFNEYAEERGYNQIFLCPNDYYFSIEEDSCATSDKYYE